MDDSQNKDNEKHLPAVVGDGVERAKGGEVGFPKGELVKDEPAGEVDVVREQPHYKSAPPEPGFFEYLIQRVPIYYLLLIPLFAILFLPAKAPIERSAASLMYPYQLDREEAFLIDQAMRLATMQSIYTPITEEPYLVGNYPPVYPALVGGLLTFKQPSLGVGRFVVAISVLIILAAMASIIIRETDALTPALLGLFLYLANWDVVDWIAYARVDFTGVAFSILGISALASKRRRTGLIVGSILFTLAFYTKQTQVIATAAAIAGLYFQGEKKLAGWLAVLVSAMSLAVFVIMNSFTNGEFWKHIIVYNKNAMNWQSVNQMLAHEWSMVGPLLIALVVGVIGAAYLRKIHPKHKIEVDLENHRPRSRALPLVFFYFLFSLSSFISVAKIGSSTNYFLEFHAASILFFCLVFGLMVKELNVVEIAQRRMLKVIIIALMICFYLQGAKLMIPHPMKGFDRSSGVMSRYQVFRQPPTREEAAFYSRVHLLVSETEGEVLLEEPIFAILTGKDIIYEPFIMTQLAKENKWDQTPFVNSIPEKRFNLIITTSPLKNEPYPMAGFTEEMQLAMVMNYDYLEQIGKYYIYIPKGTERQKYGLMTTMKNDEGRRSIPVLANAF